MISMSKDHQFFNKTASVFSSLLNIENLKNPNQQNFLQ